jgi:hypothetical protein
MGRLLEMLDQEIDEELHAQDDIAVVGGQATVWFDMMRRAKYGIRPGGVPPGPDAVILKGPARPGSAQGPQSRSGVTES